LPTTKKLMNMDLNSNLPKIMGTYGRNLNGTMDNKNENSNSNGNNNSVRGFSQFGKSLLDNKQFFSSKGKEGSNLTYNHGIKSGGVIAYEKNESDARNNYKNAPYHNSSYSLGGVISKQDYTNAFAIRNGLPPVKSNLEQEKYQGGLNGRKNDSLGMLENKIKSTEKELNQVREKLEKNNPYLNMRKGASSYYGNISKLNSYAPSYRTSQPWATHEGVKPAHGGPITCIGHNRERETPKYSTNSLGMHNYHSANMNRI